MNLGTTGISRSNHSLIRRNFTAPVASFYKQLAYVSCTERRLMQVQASFPYSARYSIGLHPAHAQLIAAAVRSPALPCEDWRWQ
jgi:hypothetical protein